MKEFERWLEKVEDKEIKNELLSVARNEKEIEDRFYKSLPLERAAYVES